MGDRFLMYGLQDCVNEFGCQPLPDTFLHSIAHHLLPPDALKDGDVMFLLEPSDGLCYLHAALKDVKQEIIIYVDLASQVFNCLQELRVIGGRLPEYESVKYLNQL